MKLHCLHFWEFHHAYFEYQGVTLRYPRLRYICLGLLAVLSQARSDIFVTVSENLR